MSNKSTSNVFSQVTAHFIDALKTGAPPWRKPWSHSSLAPGFPVNAGTERRYTGINITILWAAAFARGYELDRWLTFRQAAKIGARIRKGEKGTTVVLFKNIKIDRQAEPDTEDENQSDYAYKIARAFTVFNVEQCSGLPDRIANGPHPDFNLEHNWESNRKADDLIKFSGARVRHSGRAASYLPASDVICMPPKAAFTSTGGYYSTLMHELTHWTGHKTRLNRTGIVDSHPYKSAGYAFEELVAEIGSAFLCADYRIAGETRHESYVLSWVKLLEDDPKAIFTSSAQAWKARNYLMNKVAN